MSDRAYREEARERLKNCVGARFSAEAIVVALAGGRIGQSDWSIEVDRIISLLDDDDDYRRGFEDGLKANTRAAFAAAKQAIPERTCRVESQIFIEGEYVPAPYYEYEMECGGQFRWDEADHPSYCPNCGAKVVNDGQQLDEEDEG